MLKNYIDEDYLKGLSPELENYLWRGETNYTKQKNTANREVFNDVKDGGYKYQELMPELVLYDYTTFTTTTTGNSYQDTINRLRYCIDVASQSGSQTITLQGSNDGTNFTSIEVLTPTTTGELTVEFFNVYKYYRAIVTVTSGSINLKIFLVETRFDLLFAYKWLYLILWNAKKSADDQFALKSEDVGKMYSESFDSARFYLDRGLTGRATAERASKIISVRR